MLAKTTAEMIVFFMVVLLAWLFLTDIPRISRGCGAQHRPFRRLGQL
jgi:hypothetical protein